MKTISTDFAKELLDFAPTEKAREMGFGESQLHGAVAAYNMLVHNHFAYLADEVGMGKTYVALGVLGLLRHVNPMARVMVIAPRENIQRKWVKELLNLVRANWRFEDTRLKGVDGGPVHPPITCGSIDELAIASRINDHRDMFLRMTTFSLAVKQAEGRERCRRRLLPLVPWINRKLLAVRDPHRFRDIYGRVLNALIPDIDLLIVDEAHNLKHGFGERVSNRNRVLGFALGHPDGFGEDCPWYAKRVKRVLLLSATPFEYDYADLYRQLDVLTFGKAAVRDAEGNDPMAVRKLCDPEIPEPQKREIVGRMLLRRVAYLKMAGQKYSKNMYRREWRSGGFQRHDDPMELSNTKQRLVVGLIQKKVAEVLGGKRFNNCFQIGMLSSFESFLETMAHRRRRLTTQTKGEDANGGEPVFDGDQEATGDERRGIDTYSLESVVASYRERFGRSLPHPKLDATAKALSSVFDTGEKVLVFVRRVATVSELKAKLDDIFNQWIRRRMEEALPNLKTDIDLIFHRYREDRKLRRGEPLHPDSSHEGVNQVEEDLHHAIVDDEGGTDSFFAWFFRGQGPSGILSGAAFQKNRLASFSSAYATLFEDDHVAWLLGHPDDVLGELELALGRDRNETRHSLRQRAYGFFRARTKQKVGYPRYYVYESYQAAALQMLAETKGTVGESAQVILHERYTVGKEAPRDPPKGFPDPTEAIGLTTFFTELVKRPHLRDVIWPDEAYFEFRQRFRQREMRRELISAMARLGAAYIDLYLLAIRHLGSFKTRGEAERPEQRLVLDFLDLLEQQAEQPGFHAYRELASAAAAFETLLAVNFPEVHHAHLSELAEIYGRTLQHQVPVGRMSGGVNKRLVRQFRLPGFPLVLATTDVLQEGEDLHTFCRQVIHYGISWTPSAMEQRTGRVDRIGSLVQRNLDGRATAPDDRELIQVYYPHLADTVEKLQVRRVMERLDKFLLLIHRTRPDKVSNDSRINVEEEILRQATDMPPTRRLLESAFPVKEERLDGQLGAQDVFRPRVRDLDAFLARNWQTLVKRLGITEVPTGSPRRYAGTVSLVGGHVVPDKSVSDGKERRDQPFDLVLRSHFRGDTTLLRCISPVGTLDLNDSKTLDQLYDLQRDLGMVKVCAKHDARKRQYRVTVEGSRLFRRGTTQPEEIEKLVRKTVKAADIIEKELLVRDEDAAVWHTKSREDADA